MRRCGGQATIEMLGAVPLLLAAILGLAQLLAAGVCRELAAHAAGAGATALLQDRDAAGAARAALPGWSRAGLSVQVSGRRVRVVLRPPSAVPGLAARLQAKAVADAGPGA